MPTSPLSHCWVSKPAYSLVAHLETRWCYPPPQSINQSIITFMSLKNKCAENFVSYFCIVKSNQKGFSRSLSNDASLWEQQTLNAGCQSPIFHRQQPPPHPQLNKKGEMTLLAPQVGEGWIPPGWISARSSLLTLFTYLQGLQIIDPSQWSQ